ncbi:MAG TPA: TA system VapC family ribonuclease toxin [Polyangiaceae bacterium]
MIAVDTNVLVYAHRRESAEHPRASRILTELAGGSAPWAIPWPCLYEFYGVVTNRRIWKDTASTQPQAWRQIEAWTASPSLLLLAETPDFFSVLRPLLDKPKVCGPVVHDARVAALCLAHGVSALLSRDRDFSLFPELVLSNPFQ